jgi:hypothetical protein
MMSIGEEKILSEAKYVFRFYTYNMSFIEGLINKDRLKGPRANKFQQAYTFLTLNKRKK